MTRHRRLRGAAALTLLVALTACGRGGPAHPAATRTVAPVPGSAVGAALARSAAHPYAARITIDADGGRSLEGFLDVGAPRTTGRLSLPTANPDTYAQAQLVLMPDAVYERWVDSGGRSVKGWWRDPLEKAGTGFQVLQVQAAALLLARQDANAHRAPEPYGSGGRAYHLTGRIPVTAFRRVEPAVYANLSPREPQDDNPYPQDVTCAVWVGTDGRILRFDEKVAFTPGEQAQSSMEFSDYGPPLPVAPPPR